MDNIEEKNEKKNKLDWLLNNNNEDNFVNQLKKITKWFKKSYIVLYLCIALFGPLGIIYATPFYGIILSILFLIVLVLTVPYSVIHLYSIFTDNSYLYTLNEYVRGHYSVLIKDFFPPEIMILIFLFVLFFIYVLSFYIGTKKLNRDNMKLYEYILALYEWKNLRDKLYININTEGINDEKTKNN
jgi:hypothetical protein